MPLSTHSPEGLRRRPSPGFAAALCVVTAVIHLEDQNWFSFDKTPGYVQVGYVFLEIAGLDGVFELYTSVEEAVKQHQ